MNSSFGQVYIFLMFKKLSFKQGSLMLPLCYPDANSYDCTAALRHRSNHYFMIAKLTDEKRPKYSEATTPVALFNWL